MPPQAVWFRGREDILTFLPTGPLRDRRRFVPVHASGQVAFGTYRYNEEAGEFVGNAVHVLDFDGEQIRDVTCFLTLDGFPAFGLAETLPA